MTAQWRLCPINCKPPFHYSCKRKFGHNGLHSANGPGMFTTWDDDGNVVERKKEEYRWPPTRKRAKMEIIFDKEAQVENFPLESVDDGSFFLHDGTIYRKVKINERVLVVNCISANQNVSQQIVMEMSTGRVTTMAHNVGVRLIEAALVVKRFKS